MAGNDPNRAFEILMQLGFEDEGGLPDDQMYGQEYNQELAEGDQESDGASMDPGMSS